MKMFYAVKIDKSYLGSIKVNQEKAAGKQNFPQRKYDEGKSGFKEIFLLTYQFYKVKK